MCRGSAAKRRRGRFDDGEADRRGRLRGSGGGESGARPAGPRAVFFPLAGSVPPAPGGGVRRIRTYRAVRLYGRVLEGAGEASPDAAREGGRTRAVAGSGERDGDSSRRDQLHRGDGFGRYAGGSGASAEDPFGRAEDVRPAPGAFQAMRDSLPASTRLHLDEAIRRLAAAKRAGGKVVAITGSGPN